MASTIWQLRGSTNRVVECCVDRTAFKLHAITIVFAHETFLSETYPNEACARSRAMQVRDELLKSGAWTLVVEPTPRPTEGLDEEPAGLRMAQEAS
jgi:hypothetical protein